VRFRFDLGLQASRFDVIRSLCTVGSTRTHGSHMSVMPRTDGKLDRMVKVGRVGHPSGKTEQILILGVELSKVAQLRQECKYPYKKR
jgi:hypothetical protein